MADNDIVSARRLTLFVIIFQMFIFSVGIVAFIMVFVTSTGNAFSFFGHSTSPIVPLIALLLWVMWAPLNYFLIYKKLSTGRVRDTGTPSLVLGILQLVFGAIILGLLLLIAHAEIVDSIKGVKQDQKESAL